MGIIDDDILQDINKSISPLPKWIKWSKKQGKYILIYKDNTIT